MKPFNPKDNKKKAPADSKVKIPQLADVIKTLNALDAKVLQMEEHLKGLESIYRSVWMQIKPDQNDRLDTDIKRAVVTISAPGPNEILIQNKLDTIISLLRTKQPEQSTSTNTVTINGDLMAAIVKLPGLLEILKQTESMAKDIDFAAINSAVSSISGIEQALCDINSDDIDIKTVISQFKSLDKLMRLMSKMNIRASMMNLVSTYTDMLDQLDQINVDTAKLKMIRDAMSIIGNMLEDVSLWKVTGSELMAGIVDYSLKGISRIIKTFNEIDIPNNPASKITAITKMVNSVEQMMDILLKLTGKAAVFTTLSFPTVMGIRTLAWIINTIIRDLAGGDEVSISRNMSVCQMLIGYVKLLKDVIDNLKSLSVSAMGLGMAILMTNSFLPVNKIVDSVRDLGLLAMEIQDDLGRSLDQNLIRTAAENSDNLARLYENMESLVISTHKLAWEMMILNKITSPDKIASSIQDLGLLAMEIQDDLGRSLDQNLLNLASENSKLLVTLYEDIEALIVSTYKMVWELLLIGALAPAGTAVDRIRDMGVIALEIQDDLGRSLDASLISTAKSNINLLTDLINSMWPLILGAYKMVWELLLIGALAPAGKTVDSIRNLGLISLEIEDAFGMSLNPNALNNAQANIQTLNASLKEMDKLITGLMLLGVRMMMFRNNERIISGIDNIRNISEHIILGMNNGVVNPGSVAQMLNTVITINAAIKSLRELVDNVKSLSMMFFWFSEKQGESIIKSIQWFSNIVTKIVAIIGDDQRFRVSTRATAAMTTINIMIKNIMVSMITLMVLVPISLMFILAAPALLLGIWLFSKVLNLIIELIVKLITPYNLMVLASFAGLVLALVLLGAGMLLLASIALDVIDAFPDIMKFMLGVLAFVGLLALFGMIVAAVSFAIYAGVTGVVLVLMAVGAILLIAAALRILQEIDLDQESIKNNVSMVIQTAVDIYYQVFQTMVNPAGEPNQDPGFLKIVGMIIGGVLMSLVSSAVLVATVVSVTAILLIAELLRALQTIRLNRDRIRDNVRGIIDTAHEIIDAIFGEEDRNPAGTDKKGTFGKLVSRFVQGLSTVLDAVFSVAFIAATTISVAAILLIAGMLRVLQTMRLDREKIRNNVNIILDIAQEIISILNTPDKKSNPTKKSILGELFNVFYPPLNTVVEALMSSAYLLLMTVSIACVFGIAGMIGQIGELNMDKIEKGRDNAKQIIDTVRGLLNTILYSDDTGGNPSSRRGMMVLVDKFLPEWANILEAIFSIGYLALMTISIACIYGISDILMKLAQLDSKTIDKARDNAVAVVGAARTIMNQIFQKDETENTRSNKSWLTKILDWIGVDEIAGLAQAIVNIGKLAVLLVGIGSVSKLADMMVSIAKTNINSEIVTRKGQGIVKAASDIFNSIQTSIGDIDRGDVKDAFKVLEPMTDVFSELAKVAESMNKMSQVKIQSGVLTTITNVFVHEATTSFNNINRSITSNLSFQTDCSLKRVEYALDRIRQLNDKYVKMGSETAASSVMASTRTQLRTWDSMKQIFTAIEQTDVDDKGVRQRLALLDRISLSIKKFAKVNSTDVKNSRAIVDNYIRFIDRVDKSQIVKLKTTEQLMKHWADLSKSINGDFEGLSKTINEHILPAIDELNKTMAGVTDTQKKIIELMEMDDMTDTGTTMQGGPASGDMPTIMATGGSDNSAPSGDTGGLSMEAIAGGTTPNIPTNNAGIADVPPKTTPQRRSNQGAGNSSRKSHDYEISTALADIAKAIRGN